MANSQSTEAIPTEVAASPYHRFDSTPGDGEFRFVWYHPDEGASASFDLSSVISDWGRSSSPISEFRAAAFTRINSSSFSWSAWVSRFCVFWITKTIRNVMIVVPVLTTSCQVSDQPKNGPVIPHRTMLRHAVTNTAG